MQIPVDFLHWSLAFLPILALAFLLVQLRWTGQQAGATGIFIAAAVAFFIFKAPRWLMGRTWGTASSSLSLESHISDEVARELTLRGQPVQIVGAWSGTLGHAQAIRIDCKNGLFEGGADPRGDGAALGY